MAFLSIFHVILPVCLVFLTILLFLRSRRHRLTHSEGLPVSIGQGRTNIKRIFGHRKTALFPPETDEWGVAFTDSWKESPNQESDLHFAFTDHLRIEDIRL